ncbi:MAG: 16S rRNA (cytosine(1402)-N(4))-methyltransferase RsmH [Candidatus Zixiibacteriota bacterium]
MTRIDSFHQPVLADEAIDLLNVRPDGVYIDATAGGGGYTHRIISRLSSPGKVFAIDRDDDAVAITSERLKQYGPLLEVIHGAFGELRTLAQAHGMAGVNGIVFDLGVSGHQLDDAARGFSYREDGPLDFRMDRRTHPSASEIVNQYSEKQLADLLFELGEEKNSRKIASAIVKSREAKPVKTTDQLARLITSVTNPRFVNKTLSRCFQAIRIEVNAELRQLQEGLRAGFDLLAPEGRMVVVSYHSLEDRIVKRFMKAAARGKFDEDAERIDGNYTPFAQLITKKPIEASDEEIKENPRARSAKLRVLEKI